MELKDGRKIVNFFFFIICHHLNQYIFCFLLLFFLRILNYRSNTCWRVPNKSKIDLCNKHTLNKISNWSLIKFITSDQAILTLK